MDCFVYNNIRNIIISIFCNNKSSKSKIKNQKSKIKNQNK